MSVVIKAHQQSEPVIYVKGAPLETLQQCDRLCWNGEDPPANVTQSAGGFSRKMTQWHSAAYGCSHLLTEMERN